MEIHAVVYWYSVYYSHLAKTGWRQSDLRLEKLCRLMNCITVTFQFSPDLSGDLQEWKLLYAPISCLSMPSSQCSRAVEMLMVSVGLLFTTVMEALDRRSSVTWTTIYQHIRDTKWHKICVHGQTFPSVTVHVTVKPIYQIWLIYTNVCFVLHCDTCNWWVVKTKNVYQTDTICIDMKQIVDYICCVSAQQKKLSFQPINHQIQQQLGDWLASWWATVNLSPCSLTVGQSCVSLALIPALLPFSYYLTATPTCLHIGTHDYC